MYSGEGAWVAAAECCFAGMSFYLLKRDSSWICSAVGFGRPIVRCVICVTAINLWRLRRDLLFPDWFALIFGCFHEVPRMRG